MKPRLVELLACPVCQAELELRVGGGGAEEIESGDLVCRGCQARYPIRGGIPRLLPPALSEEKEKTARAFGYQWLRFVEMHPEYEAQFLDWIRPLQPAFFGGKMVLDAGCGIGRHAYFAARYGASEVVAMDLSSAVETAHRNIGQLPNAHVVQGDIYHPPFRPPERGGGFDFIYSIGVLHHLPDPRAGFESLLRFVRPGGTIFGWVYGHEHNGVVHYFINPLRKHVTTKLPIRALEVVSFPLAVVLHGVVKGVYRPLRRTPLFRLLPSRTYLHSLAAFGFRQNYSIVFDHLVAPTAFYLQREEYERWFTENRLEGIEISNRNFNSWRGRGEVAAAVSERATGA